MKIDVGSETVVLRDLDSGIDQMFVEFYTCYPSGQPYNVDDYEKRTLSFFDRSADRPDLQDAFFTNFTPIWRREMTNFRYDQALFVWDKPVELALAWESLKSESVIHKGTPFYFLGVTSIVRGDLDAGYAYMHQSLREDIRTSGRPTPDTPSQALVTLNYEKQDQAFKFWVEYNAAFLSGMIKEYSDRYGRKLTLEQFRQRLLLSAPSTDVVFMFVYTLGRLFNLRNVPEFALRNDFAGQIEISLLLDVTLIVDAAVASKNPKGQYFSEHAEFLLKRAGLGAGLNELREVDSRRKASINVTLTTLLDGTFVCESGTPLCGIAADVAISYVLRNHGAHNPVSITAVWRDFTKVRQSLFNTLFLAVEELY